MKRTAKTFSLASFVVASLLSGHAYAFLNGSEVDVNTDVNVDSHKNSNNRAANADDIGGDQANQTNVGNTTIDAVDNGTYTMGDYNRNVVQGDLHIGNDYGIHDLKTGDLKGATTASANSGLQNVTTGGSKNNQSIKDMTVIFGDIGGEKK